MIISHKHKFIFIKTKKTAGTSIELALSQFCGPDDVITPTDEADEQLRRELGLPAPQNCHVPLSRYRPRDWARSIRDMKRQEFRTHSRAHEVKHWVGEDIWNEYFVFCFERNPFDKAISGYFWNRRDEHEDITSYLQRVQHFSNWRIYAINNEVAMDFVGRYERLMDDLRFIWNKFNFPGEPTLPRAKGNFRTDRRHYSELLDETSRRRIEQVCAREIEYFGYTFELAPEMNNPSGASVPLKQPASCGQKRS